MPESTAVDSKLLGSLVARPSALPVRAQSALIDAVLRLGGSLPRGKSAIPRQLGRLLLSGRLYETSLADGSRMLWDARVADLLVATSRSGMWDSHVLQALKSEMRPDACCYDIGANAGLLTLAMARSFPDAEIFAFEPLPALAGSLARAVERNAMRRVTVLEAALSNCPGTITLHLPAHAIHASLRPRGRTQALTVRGETLDRLIQAGMRPPDLIKIDVEGAEMLLFEGARETLQRYLPTLVFECDQNADRFGHTTGQALGLLASFGYTRFERLYPSGEREPLTGAALHEPDGGDFIAKR